MVQEHEDFRRLPDVTSPIGRWLSLPPQIRHQIETDCIRRGQEDAVYLDSMGVGFDDLPVGTILPSGNTVIEDEKGRKLRRAPVTDLLPRGNNN